MSNRGVLSAILSDQPDDVLVDLKRQLQRRVAEARGALADSENELRLVEQALAARGTTIGSSAAADVDRDREADGRFQGMPRATILAVAVTVPDPITPARVVEAFAERGETVNVEQIRIALGRIAKDGNLTKIGPSRFALPDRQPPGRPTAQEPVAATRPAPAPPPETEPKSEPDTPVESGAVPFRWSVLGTPVNRDVFRRSS